MKFLERTQMLIGEGGAAKLKKAGVLLLGLGGVGSYAAEALVRAGIGGLTVVDFDTVSESNINRQLIALQSTVGMLKTGAAKNRLLDINPGLRLSCLPLRFDKDSADGIDFSSYDYVIDAIDTVTSKLLIAERAASAGVPLISCMGTGGKLDPSAFKVCLISETSACPLARVMRKELRSRGLPDYKCVFSTEQPTGATLLESGRNVPGSISFVPGAAGLLLAAEVIRDLLSK